MVPGEGLCPSPLGILGRCLWGFGGVSVALTPMVLGWGHPRGERERGPPGLLRYEKVREPLSTLSSERDTEPLVPSPAQAFPDGRGMEMNEHPRE